VARPLQLLKGQPWGLVLDDRGNVAPGQALNLKNEDNTTNIATYADVNGATPAFSVSDSLGYMQGYAKLPMDYRVVVGGDNVEVHERGSHVNPFPKLARGNGEQAAYDQDSSNPSAVQGKDVGIWYFGPNIDPDFYPVDHLPQGVFEKSVYYQATPDNSAQCAGSVSIMRHYDAAHAAAGRITQTKPVTGGEGDALIQGAVDTTGLVVGVAASARLQALDGYAATGQRLVNFYSGGGMAQSTGTTGENAYGVYIEDPQGNSLGTLNNRRGVWSKAPLHADDGAWFGTLLSNIHLTVAATAGDTTIHVPAGSIDVNYAQAGTQMIVGGIGGYQTEVRIIDSWDNGAGTITFHAALTNDHALGESVWSCRAGNLRWSATDFGLKTDMRFIANDIKTGQVQLTQQGGAGYVELPRQNADAATPGTDILRLYADTAHPPKLAFMPEGGTKQRVVAGPALPLTAIASPAGGGTVDAQARTAIDSIRAAIAWVGITA
jgi:hypothetical protein